MDKEILEQKAQKIISKIHTEKTSLQNLTDGELRTVLAYEMWRDGLDWENVVTIEFDPFWSPSNIIHYLQEVFNY